MAGGGGAGEGGHVEGRAGVFAAAVDVSGASAAGLFGVAGCYDAVDDGGLGFHGHVLEGAGDGAGEDVVVGGFALEDDSEADDAVECAGEGQCSRGEWDFVGAGHAVCFDVLRGDAASRQFVLCVFYEAFDQSGVETRRHDGEAQAFSVWGWVFRFAGAHDEGQFGLGLCEVNGICFLRGVSGVEARMIFPRAGRRAVCFGGGGAGNFFPSFFLGGGGRIVSGVFKPLRIRGLEFCAAGWHGGCLYAGVEAVNSMLHAKASRLRKEGRFQGRCDSPGRRAGPGDSGNGELAGALMRDYLPLVKAIVSRMRIHFPPQADVEDIYGIALTGLAEAARRCRPGRRKSFGSYAALRIRGALLDELRRMDWLPRQGRAAVKRLKNTVGELERRLGRPATEEEASRAMGMGRREYRRLLDQARPFTVLSLDGPMPGDGEERRCLHERVCDATELDARERCEKRDLARRIRERLMRLPEVPRKVLCMYYFEEMRLAEIARVFHLTESRVCQIHTQSIISLRAGIERETGSGV